MRMEFINEYKDQDEPKMQLKAFLEPHKDQLITFNNSATVHQMLKDLETMQLDKQFKDINLSALFNNAYAVPFIVEHWQWFKRIADWFPDQLQIDWKMLCKYADIHRLVDRETLQDATKCEMLDWRELAYNPHAMPLFRDNWQWLITHNKINWRAFCGNPAMLPLIEQHLKYIVSDECRATYLYDNSAILECIVGDNKNNKYPNIYKHISQGLMYINFGYLIHHETDHTIAYINKVFESTYQVNNYCAPHLYGLLTNRRAVPFIREHWDDLYELYKNKPFLVANKTFDVFLANSSAEAVQLIKERWNWFVEHDLLSWEQLTANEHPDIVPLLEQHCNTILEADSDGDIMTEICNNPHGIVAFLPTFETWLQSREKAVEINWYGLFGNSNPAVADFIDRNWDFVQSIFKENEEYLDIFLENPGAISLITRYWDWLMSAYSSPGEDTCMILRDNPRVCELLAMRWDHIILVFNKWSAPLHKVNWILIWNADELNDEDNFNPQLGVATALYFNWIMDNYIDMYKRLYYTTSPFYWHLMSIPANLDRMLAHIDKNISELPYTEATIPILEKWWPKLVKHTTKYEQWHEFFDGGAAASYGGNSIIFIEKHLNWFLDNIKMDWPSLFKNPSQKAIDLVFANLDWLIYKHYDNLELSWTELFSNPTATDQILQHMNTFIAFNKITESEWQVMLCNEKLRPYALEMMDKMILDNEFDWCAFDDDNKDIMQYISANFDKVCSVYSANSSFQKYIAKSAYVADVIETRFKWFVDNKKLDWLTFVSNPDAIAIIDTHWDYIINELSVIKICNKPNDITIALMKNSNFYILFSNHITHFKTLFKNHKQSETLFCYNEQITNEILIKLIKSKWNNIDEYTNWEAVKVTIIYRIYTEQLDPTLPTNDMIEYLLQNKFEWTLEKLNWIHSQSIKLHPNITTERLVSNMCHILFNRKNECTLENFAYLNNNWKQYIHVYTENWNSIRKIPLPIIEAQWEWFSKNATSDNWRNFLEDPKAIPLIERHWDWLLANNKVNWRALGGNEAIFVASP